jgi:molecular chaperone IbpA
MLDYNKLAKRRTKMNSLEKSIHSVFDSIDTMLFPSRFAKTFTNVGGSYPPYNIIKVSESETVLEIAVAGFRETEISVSIENNILKITGKKETTDHSNYLYKGIGSRYFERSFTLPADTKVEKAEYADGILSVFIQYELPEEKKPRQIALSKGSRSYLSAGDDIVS